VKKAVLIAPPYDFADNANVSRFTTLIAPPLGVLTLGSYLLAHDVPVELIDVQIDFGFGLTQGSEQTAHRRVARYLQQEESEIAWVGISMLSNTASGPALAREIHTALPDVPVILGGYIPSNNYEELLKEFPFLTAIVRGDGETAALQISRDLAAGRPCTGEDRPNLAWLEGGQIRRTEVEATELDLLPNLDFRLLRHPDAYQIIELITSRGCPFQCTYCLENSMRPYAVHAPQWVAQQLDHLEETVSNERVFFFDPLFGLGRERTLALCDIMRERRFTYGIESRVDVLTPQLIPLLREAGVEAIYLGVESASPSTLQRMNKVASAAQARRYLDSGLAVLRACFESGVTPFIGFMLGFPGDVETDYRATLAFVDQIRSLHDEVAAEREEGKGFVPLAFYTKVYAGSPLVQLVEEELPDVVLRSEPFVGEQTVISPSPGLDLSVARCYQEEIIKRGAYTSGAIERWQQYSTFSMEALLADHPELVDEEGVIVLSDSLRRFSQQFSLDPIRMFHDKIKN